MPSLGGPRVGPGAAAGLAGKLPGVCSHECFTIVTSMQKDVAQYLKKRASRTLMMINACTL